MGNAEKDKEEVGEIVEINTSDNLSIILSEHASFEKVQRIDDYEKFWEHVVKPDYEDYQKHTDDLRLAFHCAVTLFHLHDWIFRAHEAQVRSAFTYKDRNQTGNDLPVTKPKHFANAISDHHPDFELIRGIANAAKHHTLTHGGSPHPGAPYYAANVSSFSFGSGGDDGQGPYSKTPRVMLAGPAGQDKEFSVIASDIFDMWKKLAAQHGWNLS